MQSALGNLDVLRAFAVTCVLVAHLFRHVLAIEDLWITNVDELARFGVLVFFVHTSLVLLMSLERTSVERRPILRFYIRRLFRIYPLSIAAILLAVCFHIPFMPDHPYKPVDMSHVVQNLLLVQNITPTYSIIGPLWTLPYEVQMYIALPFIHLLLRQGSSLTVMLLWLVAIVFRVLPLAIGGWNTNAIQFVPCFLGGALAYQIGKTFRARAPGYTWPVAMATIFALYVWISGRKGEPILDYMMCLVLGGVIPCFRDMRSTPFTEISRVVAKYSYGTYLFHVPVMWVSFFYASSFLNGWLQWVLFAILSAAVPWAAYRWIEDPMITFGRRIADRVSKPPEVRAAALKPIVVTQGQI